jgi:hypothetical protein
MTQSDDYAAAKAASERVAATMIRYEWECRQAIRDDRRAVLERHRDKPGTEALRAAVNRVAGLGLETPVRHCSGFIMTGRTGPVTPVIDDTEAPAPE